LKPYGMIYDMIINFKIPIKWIIAPGKIKDGVDFTYNGVDFKGGPFIIMGEFRSPSVNARIAYWQTQGVVGVTTTSPIDVPVAMTLLVSSVPRWTMDKLYGSVAVPYFVNAGIPTSSYSLTRLPSELGYCDDIFVMPHAYPQWSTHSNLYYWNLTYKGSIWLSCTAGSELEDMFNPANPAIQTNFLSEKTGIATGAGPQCENALWLYTSHTDGTPPYTYTTTDNQFMQFMGVIDGATQNGYEQVYIPKNAGWRASTTVGIYDPDHVKRIDDALNHRAAVCAYGRAFGDPGRGYVMIEAAHSINGTGPANVAAQRIFFNFSFMAGKDATILPDMSGVPSSVVTGIAVPVSCTFPVGINPNDFTVTWSSTCGGVFVPDPAYPGVQTRAIYTPPIVASTLSCPITVSIADACGRVFNTSKTCVVTCDLQLVTTLKNACFGQTNGSITMTITGAPPPFVWSWTRSTGGTGSGTGITISGLSAGTYTVIVTSGNGLACGRTFTVTISQNPKIDALVTTPTDVLCNGYPTGSITVNNPTGGTLPFTFLWTGGVTTQNRSNLIAGTYIVTAADANNCTITASTPITQPSAIVITPTVTDVKCFGQSTGEISIAVSGGNNASYTYSWADGPITQNRTGLPAGTYSVTVTDASNCPKTLNGIVVNQSTTLAVSIDLLNTTDVKCYNATPAGKGGTIYINVTGGNNTSYNYLWSNLATTQNLLDIPAGTYSVTVTDANSCTAVLSKTITQPTAISLSTAVTNKSCPGINDGKIDLTVSGGTTPYVSYAWTGPSSYSSTSQNISGLATAGSYTVVVTDTKGCAATTTVTLGTTNSNPTAPAAINN
jgi:hypothetical protein